MYLERDVYLLENRKDFADDKELYAYLSEKFEMDVPAFRGSYSTFNTCFLTYLGYYVSSFELSGMFSSFYGTAAGRTKLAKMVGRKIIGQVRFVSPDGGSRGAYHLSREGLSTVLSQMPNDLRTQVKLRRSGGKVPVHDYATGMCMLQLLLTPYTFNFRKEYSVARDYGKERGSLCIDAYVNIKGDYPYALAIEQDMGTESTATLVAKLYAYNEHGLTTQRGLSLVVACHSNISVDECPSFMLTYLQEIYESMAAAGMDNLYEYYVRYGSRLSEKGQKTLVYLMLRVGVLKAINGKGTNIELSSYRYGTDTICKLKSAPAFTLSEVSRYIEDLKLCRNPYYLKEYNKRQYANASGTFRAMVRMLKRLLDDGAYHRMELSCLLKGFSCYVLPTAMLSNYTKYVTPRIYGMERMYYACCREYFLGMDMDSFTEYSPILYTEDGDSPGVIMRNCFTYNHGIVCFEYVSHDVGAFVRCLYIMGKTLPADKSLQIVAVCDDSRDAYYLAKELSMYHNTHAVQHGGVFLSYVLTGDLNRAVDSDTSVRLRGVSTITGKPGFVFLDKNDNGTGPFASAFASGDGYSDKDSNVAGNEIIPAAGVHKEVAKGNAPTDDFESATLPSYPIKEQSPNDNDVSGSKPLADNNVVADGSVQEMCFTMEELAGMLFSGMPSDDDDFDDEEY